MKRIISTVAAFALILSSLTFSAFADGETQIATAEQLFAITDGGYVLTADIDLSAYAPFTSAPITAFSGTLDGNGHTVSGLDFVITSGMARVGLIETLTGTVKNLVVKGCAQVAGEYARVGSVAATSNGAVQNCRADFDITVNVTGNAFIGGIVGYNREASANGTVTDCWASGDILVTGAASAYVGGVTCAYGTADGCTREGGNITLTLADGQLGYAAGIAAYEAAVRNCVNRANVSVTTMFQAYAAGASAFFGSSAKLTLQRFENSGDISARITGGDEIDAGNAICAAGGAAAYTANTAKVGATVNESACTSVVRNVRNSGAVASSAEGGLPDYAGGSVGVVNGLVYNCVETRGAVTGTACGTIYGALNPSGVLRGKVRDCTAYGSGTYNTVNGTPAADGAVASVSDTEAAEAAAAITITNTHTHFYNVRFVPASGGTPAADRTVCDICGDHTDAPRAEKISVDITAAVPPVRADGKVQISWRGLVSSDGTIAIDVDKGFSDGVRRVGMIYSSTNKAEYTELAKKALTDCMTGDIDAGCASFNESSVYCRLYSMAPSRQLYWCDQAQAWTYRYNFNVTEGKKRAAIAFVIYYDGDGAQISFSNPDIQTALVN